MVNQLTLKHYTLLYDTISINIRNLIQIKHKISMNHSKQIFEIDPYPRDRVDPFTFEGLEYGCRVLRTICWKMRREKQTFVTIHSIVCCVSASR